MIRSPRTSPPSGDGSRYSEYGPARATLLGHHQTFGKQVEASPKKAYVSLRLGKQFAILQPSTTTRIDVGLVLPGVEPSERLEASGSFNAMMTHRVRVAKPSEVDEELVGWLRQAYDLADPSAAIDLARKPKRGK